VIIGEKRKLELVPLLIFYIKRIDKLTGFLLSVTVANVDERVLSIACVTLDTNDQRLHLGPPCMRELAHSLIETKFKAKLVIIKRIDLCLYTKILRQMLL
jgi:hypothetical protein